jgi:hypothetical protein
MCRDIVKELVTQICYCSCVIALACCNGTECSKKCWVNYSCIVQEVTNNILDIFDLLWGEGLCGVNLHPLNPCPILDQGRLVGSILGRDWCGVLVLWEGFVDVPGHMAIDVSYRVVPGYMSTAKQRTRQIDCHCVVLLQCVDEVILVMHVGDLDAKIIKHQAEHDVLLDVAPETRSMLALVIPV